MREKSNYPNRKHTPDSLREELEYAQRAGSANEIADLTLLLAHAERPPGSAPLDGVLKARNRQAQRRFHRERLPAGKDYNDPDRKRAVIGDWVEDINTGQRWRVTRVLHDTCWHDVPGEPIINAPWRFLRIVRGPHPDPADREMIGYSASAPASAPAYAEALYQGVWDAIEQTSGLEELRSALEVALRAYEANAPAQAASTP